MVLLVLYLIAVLSVLVLGAACAWSDVRRMNIPNIYPALIAVLFFPAWLLQHTANATVMDGIGSHMVAGVVMLAVTMVMFFCRLMGGGDSKLAAAYSLWTGLHGMVLFLFYMAFAGGALSLVALALKRFKPFKNPPEGTWIARVQGGEAVVPYGVALFVGAVIAFWKLDFLSPAHLREFVADLG